MAFLKSKGIDVQYPTVYRIVNGKKMPFNLAHNLSIVFTNQDIPSWEKINGKNFVEYFVKIIPSDFLSKQEKSKIIKKYGAEIEKDFTKLKKIPFFTLQSIADKYGITRERVRQMYTVFFNKPYTKALSEKNKKRFDTTCRNNPKRKVAEYTAGTSHYYGAIAEKLFMCRCEKLGFNIKLLKEQVIDILVNDKLIEVKATNQNTGRYYQCSTTHKQTFLCDFFAFYVFAQDCFYIIPNKNKGEIKRKGIFIPIEKTEHQYSQYKNNFNLLAAK